MKRLPKDGDGDTNDLICGAAIMIWCVFCICHVVSSWKNEILSAILWCISIWEVWWEVWIYFVSGQWKQEISQASSHLITEKNPCREGRSINPPTTTPITPPKDHSKGKTSIEAPQRTRISEDVPVVTFLFHATGTSKSKALAEDDLHAQPRREWYPSNENSLHMHLSSGDIKIAQPRRSVASPKSVTFPWHNDLFNEDSSKSNGAGRYQDVGREEHLKCKLLRDETRGDSTEAVICVVDQLSNKHSKDSIDFFLPKLHLWCQCSHCELYLNYKKVRLLRSLHHQDIAAFNLILRPWQVEFLSSVGIYSLSDLIRDEKENAEELRRSLMMWRNDQKLQQYSVKSCTIALHIWAQAASTVLKSRTLPLDESHHNN